jgi:putative DNA primase/helicase
MTILTEHITNETLLYSQNTSRSDAEEALAYISPDICRDEWVQVAMALKSELGDDGYAVFDTWSQGSDKYKESDCKSTWRSINGDGGVTIATLFGKAKEGGYKATNNGVYKPFRAPLSASKPSPIDEPKDLTKSCEIAQKFWDESVPGKAHPYADKKGFPDHRLRVNGKWLVAQAYNAEGQIQSAQRINGKEKLNLKGCTIKGAYYPIAGDTSTVVICEGWATGKSINAATRFAVAVAFGKGNLKCIAQLMQEKFPDSQLIVAAENDHVKIAEEAAMSVRGLVVIPW